MKIAIINNLYHPFNRGGAEQVVAQIIKERQLAGDDVFLVTTKPPRQPEPHPLDLKIYWLKSQYYNLAQKNIIYRLFWQISNIFSFKKYRQIKKIFEKEKPNRVLTHNLIGLGFRLPLLARRRNIPQEHFLHDIQLLHPSGLMIAGQEKRINSLSAKIYQALTRMLFASPAKVISPSRWLLTEHQKRGFFKKSLLEVKPWPEEKNSTLPTRPVGELNFLFVGQIEEHKGILFLIKAWRDITSDKNIKAKLLIIGSGEKLTEAQKLASDNKQIEFLGRLNLEALKKVMERSYYLIVPSLCYENSPTIITIAHSYGLPVIASNLGGIPEMLKADDKSFKAGDQVELVNILKKIIRG